MIRRILRRTFSYRGRVAFLGILLLIIPSQSLRAELVLAVWELVPDGKIDPVHVETYSQWLRQEVGNTGVFNVLERSEMEERLVEEVWKWIELCRESCLTTIGKNLEVERIVGGEVGMAKGEIQIALMVLDVNTGKRIWEWEDSFPQEDRAVIFSSLTEAAHDLETLPPWSASKAALQRKSGAPSGAKPSTRPVRSSGRKQPDQPAAAVEASSKKLKAPRGCEPKPGTREDRYTNAGWAREVIHKRTGIEMVLIPPATFTMGSQRRRNERPVHDVEVLKPFYLGKCEVTLPQYWQFVKATGYTGKGDADGNYLVDLKSTPGLVGELDRPAFWVSWKNAKAYCEWAGLRLPSEAEWEHACQAGSKENYCFGDKEQYLEYFGWYGRNSSGKWQFVGQRAPNDWGVFDMHGNMWEWCEDRWRGNYTGAPLDGTARIKGGSRGKRTLRGGGWRSNAEDCRSASRTSKRWNKTDRTIGFRAALDVPWRPSARH